MPSAWSPSSIPSGIAPLSLPRQSPPPGATLWFDGRETCYSDAGGTIISAPPLGRVARVNQPSSATAGSWLTRDAAAGRSWKSGESLDLRYGETTYFAQPAGLGVPANGSTWGFCFQHRSSTSQTCALYFGSDGASNWGITLGNTITISAAGTVFDSGIVVIPGSTVYGTVVYKATTIDVTVYVNGVLSTYSTAAANASGSTSVIKLGSAVSDNYHSQMAIGQVIAYGNTSVSQAALLSFLAQCSLFLGFPVDAPLVAVAGDSISQGVTATAALSQFYLAQANLAGSASPPRMLNAGLSNLDLPGLASRYATEIKPHVNSARLRNVLMVQCMTNSMPCSMGTAAATAAAVLAAYYAYCDQARADGWTVVLFTCLPRAGAGTGFPTAWATVNADIRANYLSHGSDLADVAGAAGVSLISDATSGPNFTDQLHPTNAGQAIIEVVVRAAMSRRLS